MIDLSDLGATREEESPARVDFGDLGGQPTAPAPVARKERRINFADLGGESAPAPTEALPPPQFRPSPADTGSGRGFNLPRDLTRGVGSTFGGAGKIATAVVADAARAMRGERPQDIPALVTTDAAIQPGIDLPIETAVKESALEEKQQGGFPKATVSARMALGLAKSTPKVATVMGTGGGSLLAEAGIAGGLFGLDDEGNFHPKEAIVGALLPGVGRVGRIAVGAAIGKTLASGGMAPMGATGQKVMETIGEQAAMDAYMTVADAPELIRLAKEDPSEFRARLAETIGSNLAFALFGAGRFAKDVPSATKDWVLKNADSLATRKVIESYSPDELRDIYGRVNAGQRASQAEKDLVSMINSQLGKPAEAIKKGVEIVEQGWPEKLAQMLGTEAPTRVARVPGEPVQPKPRGRSLRLLTEKGEEANAVNPILEPSRLPSEPSGVVQVGQTPDATKSRDSLSRPAGQPPEATTQPQAARPQPAVIPIGGDLAAQVAAIEAPAREFAKASGFEFKSAGVAGTEGLPPDVAAKMPRTWEFTDRRLDSPTQFTFYVPAGSSTKEIQTAFERKKAEFAKSQTPKPDFMADNTHPIGSREWRMANTVPEDWTVTPSTDGGWVAESPATEKGGQWGKLVKTANAKGEGRQFGVRTEKPVPRKADDLTGLSEGELDAMLDEASKAKPVAPVAPKPAPKPTGSSLRPKTVGQEIKQGLTAMTEGAKAAFRKRLEDQVAKGGATFSKPGAVSLVKSDPTLEWKENNDGSVTVTAIKVKERTATDIAKEAAKAGVKGVDESIQGLHDLFGGGTHMGTGPSFDEQTYAKAKPHFKAAYDQFKKAGKSLKEFFEFIFKQFGERIRPYLKRFIQELQAEGQRTAAKASSAGRVVADWVSGKLRRGEAITAKELFAQADIAHGKSQAEGGYSPKDAYDAMELGVNRYIREGLWLREPDLEKTPGFAQGRVLGLKQLVAGLPTQTARDKEMDQMQQFSTPPPLAYVAAWVANIQPGDVMLEPSAGLAGIAVFGKNAGATVIANELSARRLALLQESGIADHVTNFNAEQLHALLEPLIASGQIQRPTVVVMNPPFSNAAKSGETKNTLIGAQHVEQALKLLPNGGRLVAIVGEGMADHKAMFNGWWNKIKAKYNVRANIGISGDEYRKYGTSFGNQLLVIDNTGQSGPSLDLNGSVQKIEELLPLLEEIRNERAGIQRTEPAPVKPGSVAAPAAGGSSGKPAPGAPAASGAGIAPGGTRPAGSGTGGVRPEPQRPTLRPKPPAKGSASGGRGEPAAAATPGSTASDAEEAARDGLTLEQFEAGRRELSDAGVFAEYHPAKVRVAGAKQHPTPLVEPTAMAAVELPDPTYSPKLPKDKILEGFPSIAQIEAVVYAGQAHDKALPTGERLGFFMGDGTGVGKGLEIAAVIVDNWNRGRKKAVWVSKTGNLINDSAKYLGFLGFDPKLLLDMGKGQGKLLQGAEQGIAFATYTGLSKNNPGIDPASIAPDFKGKPKLNPTGADKKKSRMQQLYEWLGPDFDGVIAFDEVHLAGNAIDTKGNRGTKKASERGRAVVDIQKLFPKARILYVSATGATDVTNLSYGDRLGIWGHGTAFPSKQAFFDAIRAGGLSAMEIVARDLKSMGRYVSRTLSFEGVNYDQLPHKLTEEQKGIYNESARAWQLVFQQVDAIMGETGANQNGRARSAALSALYGAEQRFYSTLLTAMQMPTVIEDVKKQLEAGNSVLMQIVNTNEATLGRELADKATEEDLDLENLDLSPKDTILQYVDNCFPTTKYEPVADDEGNVTWQPVRDAQGNPVDDPEAVRRKLELMDRLALLKMPQNPLEMVFDIFGADNVAEVTGRSRRVIQRKQEDGTLKRVLETNRGEAQRKVETDEFNDGKRRILIFSDAGGTGFTYAAIRTFKNQQRRAHYLIQAGWRADQAVQGMGRSHRANQAVAPLYKLPSTDIKGHQRFISTIARRLGQLGALSSGERESTGGGLFDETNNLENDYAEDAVTKLFFDLFAGSVEGFKFDAITPKLGYIKTLVNPRTGETEVVNLLKDSHTGQLNVDKIPTIQQFLNRILALEFDEQNAFFEEFFQRLKTRIDNAKADGSYDPGTQTLKALTIKKLSDDVVYEDKESTAKTRLVEVEYEQPLHPNNFEDIWKIAPKESLLAIVKNKRSDVIYAIKTGPVRTMANGSLVETYRRISPTGDNISPRSEVRWEYGDSNYDPIAIHDNNWDANLRRAQEEWDEQVREAPKTIKRRSTYVVGAFLPIWDRLQLPSPKIWRIGTDDGETFLGANVPPDAIADLRSRLGAGTGAELTPEQAFDDILTNGRTIKLSNGWTLKRSLRSGENRIEVLGVDHQQMREFEQFIGGYMERIQFVPRFFVPTERIAGIEALKKILTKAPPIQEGGQEPGRMASLPAEAQPYTPGDERRSFKTHSLDTLRAELPHVGLPEEAQRLLGAFLDSPLAKVLPEIQVRIADTLDGGWQGSYFQQVAEIARNANPETGVHELLHAAWEILPVDIKEELERMRVAALDSMVREAKEVGNDTFALVLEDVKANPTRDTDEFVGRNYHMRSLRYAEAYPFSSAEEFFAHSASNRFKQRVGSIQEGFWARVKQFIKDFIEALKRALRLKPKQADVLDRVLDGDFEPAKPEQVTGRQGSIRTREQAIAEGEREGMLPTKVFGEEYYVLDREQINEQTIAASSVLAKNVLTDCGLPAEQMPVTDEENGRSRQAWVMAPQGRDMSAEGRRLIERFKQELSKSPPGKATQELASLINSVRINFQMGSASAMGEMQTPVRNELWRIAQSDASARGIALAALAGYAKDIKFVGRNMDVELGHVWNQQFDGDELRRVIDDLKGQLSAGEATIEDLQAQLDKALRKKGRKGLRKMVGRNTVLSRKIVEIIKAGGDAWDVLKELAIKNGWKVPTDADLAKIKAWVEEWESLERLNPDEQARAGTAKAARDAALREKLAVTEKRRADLRKQVETAWSRFTKPMTLRTATGRANVTQAIGEFVSANLLLKEGFATRQTIDVLTQGALYTPTRAVEHALGIHQKEVEAGRRNRADVWQVVADTGNALKQAYYQRTKALGGTLMSVGEVLRGHDQGKHVARLMGRVSIFDRAMQKADEAEARGDRGQAFLLRLFTVMRLGYRVAQAMDQLHGNPAVYQEMRQQVVAACRENGMTRAEAETKADWVMGDIKAEMAVAVPQAELTLQTNGVQADQREIKAAAYRLVQAKQYERMRALALPADDFADRNLELLDTLGWNEAESGGVGGVIAGVMRGGGRLAAQMSAASPVLMPLSIPLLTMTRFGNAIGILINRKLSFTPLGFFPGAFGVNEAEIDSETGIATRGSPWYRTEEDRRQRKVEASVGTAFQIALFSLVVAGVIRVLLKWPKDKEERQLWDKMGWRPGQVHIPTGSGEHITLSMNTGPMVVLSPGLSAGGALHDLMEDRAKRQKKLDDEAAKLGIEPGKILPISTADLMGVAGSAAWGSIISGRTLSGLLGSVSEFGAFQPVKTAASTISAISPGLPGLQELDRLAFGTVLDSKIASVWDFLMPLPTSGAAQTNLLGDPVGEANGLQRVVSILTGGNYPLPVNDKDRQAEAAYRVLFESGYRPPSIDPNKAYSIDGKLRPLTGAELAKYTEMRGKSFKEGLSGVDPSDKAGAKAAYQAANQEALQALGVETPARQNARSGQSNAGTGQMVQNAGGYSAKSRPSLGSGLPGAGRTAKPSLRGGLRRVTGPKRPSMASRGKRGPSVRLAGMRSAVGLGVRQMVGFRRK